MAASGAQERPRAAEAGLDAAVAPLPEVAAEASDAAAGLQPAAAVAGLGAAVAPLPEVAAEASDAAAELPQAEAASDVLARRQAARPSAVHPSVAALVFRRDQPLAVLEQPRAARSAHAMQRWRVASPSTRSWQAARDEGLS
jgi:hypothetical protein